jgi:hypothetical protein
MAIIIIDADLILCGIGTLRALPMAGLGVEMSNSTSSQNLSDLTLTD